MKKQDENEKYIYYHGQSEGWNVKIDFYGNGPDVAPSHTFRAYFSAAYYGDLETAKRAARRHRNICCREVGLPVPLLIDRYRKHAPPHYLVAQGHTGRRRHA